jgi:hypothetical protein
MLHSGAAPRSRYLAAFFLPAQYFRIRSACCLRCAAVKVRFFLAGAAEAATVATVARGFFGGRPRRFVGPCRASIARFSLSRSSIRSVRICSVGIDRILA